MSEAAAHTGHRWRTLRRSRDVRRVMARGRRWSGELVVVYVSGDDGRTRAGFATPRAVGGAVARNRARRVMKEAWRAVAPAAAGGYALMVVARPEIGGATSPQVGEDLRSVLRAAEVLP